MPGWSHAGLQGAVGIDFGEEHARAKAAARVRAALAHVAVARHHHDLARHHDVGGALDAVEEGFATAVQTPSR
jgi:hypothetical protein